MKLHLIRHAKTKEAENNIHQNDDVSIIKELVNPSLCSNLKPEKIYSSPYLRARQTAKMLFGDYEVLDFLHEFKSPNLLKGKPREYGFEFWEKYLPDVRKNPDWKFDGSESFNDVINRVVFVNLEIKKEHEKTFLLSEITKLKKEVQEKDKEKPPLKENISTQQKEFTPSSVFSPFSSLINKLLEEKACYQKAIANIKMEDVNRLNQIRENREKYNEECKANPSLEGCTVLVITKEEFLLMEKTDRENLEEKIHLVDEWLGYLHKGQYPPSGNPSDMNFCEYYKAVIAL